MAGGVGQGGVVLVQLHDNGSRSLRIDWGGFMGNSIGLCLAIAGAAFAVASQAHAITPAADTPVSSEIHASAPSCELHIFPTIYYINSSLEFGSPPGLYGMAGDLMGSALTSAQRSGSGALIAPGLDQMRTLLSPEIQVVLIRDASIGHLEQWRFQADVGRVPG